MDEEGFIYIKDRAKDLVIRGGENIACREVEDAIYEHPKVFERLCSACRRKGWRTGGCRNPGANGRRIKRTGIEGFFKDQAG